MTTAQKGINKAAKGSRLEIKCRDDLRAAGYQAFKVSRSLGPYDVLAWDAISYRHIQVKSGGKAQRNVRDIKYKVRREMETQSVPEGSTQELWIWYDRAWLKYELVKGMQGMEWKASGRGA